MPDLIVVRHGETEWSLSGQHTGTTDIPLTERGERQARELLDNFGEREFAKVLVSPRQRARRTAELAGIDDFEIDEDLVEWDYGELEGVTTAEYNERREAEGRGSWNLWTDGAPGGESAEDVAARVDRVIARTERLRESGDVLVVGHSHLSRMLVVRWLGLPARYGENFLLDAAHWAVLGHKRGAPVVKHWGVPPHA
ncbi:histidine phosphatase family protein [Georgenia muralis]|uniref:Putative phosphoglycerate mutase n=1 Tax=Georgenia muralis TaxID=154117 RepID=A0A3N4Z3Z6_9MICO|nr:histidine phosphatase family protein [Georgenia muralis]RPF26614.1 putative phosphoglycerate mutase [Georgenia muralis]